MNSLFLLPLNQVTFSRNSVDGFVEFVVKLFNFVIWLEHVKFIQFLLADDDVCEIWKQFVNLSSEKCGENELNWRIFN